MGLTLPTPPTDKEKWSYLKANGLLFYLLNSVSVATLLTGAWLFTLSNTYFAFYGVMAFLSLIYLGLSVIVGFVGRGFKFHQHTPFDGVVEEDFPTVDVFLPCAGEPIEILTNTHYFVSQLDWPKDKINVYVMDDGDNKLVEASAQSYGYNYVVRPNRGEHKKAGNLRHTFANSKGDLILILDADFVPRPDMLKEMVGYFTRDPKLAILQTAQFFRILDGQGWLEKGAAYVQEVFYRLIQVKRNHFGAALCVGTNALYRRSALEPFGGTALIDHSEDVHTGVNCMSLGYKVRYVPVNLACGVCPDNSSSFFNQQYRWAMGSISLFLNRKSIFWQSKLTLMQRFCFSTGLLYYLTTSLAIFFQPLPAIVILAWKPELVHFFNAFFTLPSLLFGTLFLAFWTKAPWGTYAIFIRNISCYAHLYAWRDGVFGKKMQWVASGTKVKNSQYRSFLWLLFWWNLVVGSITLVLAGYRLDMVGYHVYPIIFLTLFNMWASWAGFFKD